MIYKGEKMNLLKDVLDLITKFTITGGALWMVWGAVILGTALKDKNGPSMQSGIWQIVGGGLIIAATALFSSITT